MTETISIRSRIIGFIGWLIIYVLNRTLKVRAVNAPETPGKAGPRKVLFSFWHGEQLITFFRHRGQGIVVMSSLSKDGEMQSEVLKRFGAVVVRGSSSKGGDRALVETIRLVKKGHPAAFAADGPRGPYHKIKPGVIFAARKTGCPVIPLSTAAKSHKVLEKAWDKYQLAAPFSEAVVAYGNPLIFEENDDLEGQVSALETEMEKLSEFTHKYYWSEDVREYIAHHPSPRILIVQPSRIGDVVFAMPAVSEIRKLYPRARISWLVDERCAPVLEGSSEVDELIIFDRKKISLPYILRMMKSLRGKQFDLSIDFHGLFKSAFMVWLAGAKFKLASSSTYGMREFSGLFSEEIKTTDDSLHCVQRHLRVAEYLGAPAGGSVKYFINPSETEAGSAFEKLKKAGSDMSKPLVAIHPGGGWIARRWFTERFAELSDRLARELNAQVVLIGGKEGGSGEKGLNEEIMSAAKLKPIDMTGALSLRESIALIGKVSLYIGNEAGPMHMAVALNRPVVALIGPTNVTRTGPFRGNTAVMRHVVECQPCRNRNCASRECMALITVDEVFAAAKEKLKR